VVFQATIRADEDTDVDATVADLCAQCERAGLAANATEMILGQARAALAELVDCGRQLSAIGSQMHVAREVVGDGFLVKLIFRAGDQRTLFQRLLDALRGR
jgi:hypothetical protein